MATTQSAAQNIPSNFLKKTTYEAPGAKRDSFTYDHIPALKELLPRLRGVPGLYYLQCAVQNQILAEEEGWAQVADTVTYSIQGPSGTCDVRLYCCGTPIPGAGYQASKRICVVDRVIMLQTGLANSTEDAPPEESDAGEEPSVVDLGELPTMDMAPPKPTGEPTVVNASAKPVKKEKSDG